MAATAQEKAYNLKDNYVADLVDKGKKDNPVLPETKHGDVAIDPITATALGIGGLLAAKGAAIWHIPELNRAFGNDKRPEAEYQNDLQNKDKVLLNLVTNTGYRSDGYDTDLYKRTGKIKNLTYEEKKAKGQLSDKFNF